MYRGKLINNVYFTTNLDIFRTMEGNRHVGEDRVKQIIKSINNVGFVNAPIICNEYMEVIDGQGRLEACKRLKIGIAYTIIKGLGIEECRSMNINQKNWSVMDYIQSYADSGNENYIRITEYVKSCGYVLSIALWMLFVSKHSNKASFIKSGTAVCTEEMVQNAKSMAEYVHQFDDIETNRRTEFCQAVGHCFRMECVDKERLVKKAHQFPQYFSNIANVVTAIEQLEKAYNTKINPLKKIYIKTEYLKSMDERMHEARKAHSSYRMSASRALQETEK